MKVLRQSEISCLWWINLYTQKKSCLEKYYCLCVERIQPQLAGMSIWQKLLIMAIGGERRIKPANDVLWIQSTEMHIHSTIFPQSARGDPIPTLESSHGIQIFITMETFSYMQILYMQNEIYNVLAHSYIGMNCMINIPKEETGQVDALTRKKQQENWRTLTSIPSA